MRFSTTRTAATPPARNFCLQLSAIAGLVLTLAACGGGEGGESAVASEASELLTTPKHGLRVELPESLMTQGMKVDRAPRQSTVPSNVSVNTVLDKVDAYADYWISTRSRWAARRDMIQPVTTIVVNDCTFRCAASPNGLCSGQTDNYSWTRVSLYTLRRAATKPRDWDTPGAYFKARRSQDMQALSHGNNAYWTEDEPNDYYWCELREGSNAMPALLHEWDHVLPGMDPHDPADLALVQDLPLGSFDSALTIDVDHLIGG